MWTWLQRFLTPHPSQKSSGSDIEHILRHEGRGIYKRIDENRELLLLLQQCAPTVLRDHFWVESWLNNQDRFLCRLANTLDHTPTGFDGLGLAPRPWPGSITPSQTTLLEPPAHLRRPPITLQDLQSGCPHSHGNDPSHGHETALLTRPLLTPRD